MGAKKKRNYFLPFTWCWFFINYIFPFKVMCLNFTITTCMTILIKIGIGTHVKIFHFQDWSVKDLLTNICYYFFKQNQIRAKIFLEAVYMSFHFGEKWNIFAMLKLQTTRNELIAVCETEMKLISGSLELWYCKNISFHPEMKAHVNGLLVKCPRNYIILVKC